MTRSEAAPKHVTVFYKPGCPFGIRLRIGLILHRISFTAVRFRDDEAGAAMVRKVNGGNEISPTVQIGDRYLSNPSISAVAQARSARPIQEPPLENMQQDDGCRGRTSRRSA